MNSHKRNESGFTLMELMVIIGIIGIMAAIVVPNYIRYRSNMQLNSASRDFYTKLQMAKMAAIKKKNFCSVSFNSSVNGTTYGYIIYKDLDEDLTYDTGEEIIYRGSWEDYGSVSLNLAEAGGTGLSFNNGAATPSIAFGPDGLPKDTTGDLGSGTLFLANATGKKANIVVTQGGNIRIESL